MLTFIRKTIGRKAIYLCSCGKETEAFISNVNRNHTTSCGCLRIQVTKNRSTKHGHKANGTRSKAYVAWVGMKVRCNNINRREAKDYILRGIDYDPAWETFQQFLDDMGEPISSDLSIDRIDNNKGYSKENCRWATAKQQNLNKRNCTAYTYKGKTQTISEWGEELGINYVTLHKRLQRGIPIEIAFSHKGYLKQNAFLRIA